VFPSDSELPEVFLRPNLGDFGLVVGIYISNTHKLKMLNFLNGKRKLAFSRNAPLSVQSKRSIQVLLDEC